MADLKPDYEYLFKDKNKCTLFRKEGIGNLVISINFYEGYKPHLELDLAEDLFALIDLNDYHINSKGEVFNSRTDITLEDTLREYTGVRNVYADKFLDLQTGHSCSLLYTIEYIRDMFEFDYTPSNAMIAKINPLVKENLNMIFTKAMDQNSKQALTMHIDGRGIHIHRSGYDKAGYFSKIGDVYFDQMLRDPETGEIVYKLDPHYETYMPIKKYILEECGLREQDWDVFTFDRESSIPRMTLAFLFECLLNLLQWKSRWSR